MSTKSVRIFLIKIAVTAGILGLLVYAVDFKALVAQFERVSWQIFFVAALWYIAATLVSTVRWSLLLRVQNIVLPFVRLVAYNLSYTFYSIVLPGGKVAAEGVRVYQVLRDTHDESIRTKIVFPTLLDRAVVVFSAAVISTIFFLVVGFETFAELPAWFPYAGIALVLLVAGSIFLPIERLVAGLLGFPPGQKKSTLASLKEALSSYRSKPLQLIIAVLLSVGMLAMLAAALQAIATAFDAPVSTWLVIGIVSVSMVAAFLPLTIGGVGIREGVFAYLFSVAAGVPLEVALAISLTGLVSSHVVTLLGSFVEFHRHFLQKSI